MEGRLEAPGDADYGSGAGSEEDSNKVPRDLKNGIKMMVSIRSGIGIRSPLRDPLFHMLF